MYIFLLKWGVNQLPTTNSSRDIKLCLFQPKESYIFGSVYKRPGSQSDIDPLKGLCFFFIYLSHLAKIKIVSAVIRRKRSHCPRYKIQDNLFRHNNILQSYHSYNRLIYELWTKETTDSKANYGGHLGEDINNPYFKSLSKFSWIQFDHNE